MYEMTEIALTNGTTLETSLYEDGYVQVSLVDQMGLEIASMDGSASAGRSVEALVSALHGHIIAQHGDFHE